MSIPRRDESWAEYEGEKPVKHCQLDEAGCCTVHDGCDDIELERLEKELDEELDEFVWRDCPCGRVCGGTGEKPCPNGRPVR
jgi:hypothetical protein